MVDSPTGFWGRKMSALRCVFQKGDDKICQEKLDKEKCTSNKFLYMCVELIEIGLQT